MSKDFIVFDPSGLEFPSTKEGLNKLIHSLVGQGEECLLDLATEKIDELLSWAGKHYGFNLDEHSNWSSWPPILLANGRYCTFNLSLNAEAMTFMMSLSDQCKRLGLVMIDPSGRDSFITIPFGGGLLD